MALMVANWRTVGLQLMHQRIVEPSAPIWGQFFESREGRLECIDLEEF